MFLQIFCDNHWINSDWLLQYIFYKNMSNLYFIIWIECVTSLSHRQTNLHYGFLQDWKSCLSTPKVFLCTLKWKINTLKILLRNIKRKFEGMGTYPWMETLFNWCQFLPSSFIRIKNSNSNTNISFLWTEHNNSKTYLEEKIVENKQNIFVKEL